ncbi:hypothetical protein BTO00_22585 [Vibrio campbellii]|uniref:FG-GAP repeat protein n=1 Tax=Vibrio campbellii TaxID=680 RepID=UPI000CF3FA01|nr:FG-GAP repeat protein [Vibrio campbellii]PQJ37874.1 hypothetical protein BTO00_22585 [Vibrio campbellii]
MKILRTEQTTYHASNMVMSGDGKRVVMNVPTMAYVFDVAMVAGEPDWGGSWTMTSINHGMSNYYISGEISANGSVLVFAQVNNPTGYYTGRVRIYQFINGSWDYQTQYTGASSGSYFGYSSAVSSNGDVIAVGAMKQDNTGYVYVYRYNGTNWALEQSFRHANYGTHDYLGVGVSINEAGDRIAVGARQEDGATNSITNQGAVFVFDYDGSSWSETQALRASDAAAGDGFGFQTQLSADGRKLVVSSLDVDTVYSYDLTNDDTTQWQASETIFSSPLSTTDEFGTYGIDFNGKDIVVGAHSDDYNYKGIVTNSDNNTTFDANDTSSTGTVFDNTDTSIINSGGVYVIANEPYALSSLDSLQARVDGSNAILAWAAGGSTAPTAQQYKDAGIENVTASNLADINTQLQSLAHTDMATVQPMVDAINTILAYTTDATNTAPNNTDYTLAGINGVDANNADTLNGYVGGQNVVVADIQGLVTQVNHLLVLRAYSADATNTEPILENFTGAGISTSRAANLADYNSELVNQTLTTDTEFQALVDAINALDDYADGNTTTAPSLATYHTAGFDELKEVNLAVLNTALVNNILTSLSDVQTAVSALDTLVNYALDNTSTTPTVGDYTNAGVTSVGSNILNYLNSHLDKEKRDGLTHYLKASNAHENDYFGYQTEISDDGLTLAVLAYRAPSTTSATDDAGSVYMYRRNGDTWIEVAILRSEQTSNHAWDMAMTPDGERVVMLAPYVAYIFDVPTVDSQPDWDGTWSRTNYSHGESDSSLYLALSADGKTLVTSDGYYNTQSGRVRVHQEVDGNWTYRTQFSGSSYTYFGEHSITVNGDGSVIAVGAYAENLQQGYVDIYRQSSETSWTRTRNNLAASNGTRGDYFGYTVSLNRAGDRLAVGAKYEDGESITINDQGAVYIFDYDGSSWNEIQILRASDAAAGDDFGEWVVLTGSGDQLAVSTQDAEAVYTYDLSNADSTTWQSTENSFASPSSRTDEFGTWGLAFNGNDVVVGAYHDDTGYQGIVTNSDANSTFDDNDASSTGTSFDNTDTSIANSGGAYVIANEPYALTSLDGLQARVDASNAILAWAAGGSTAPTVQQYKDAGIGNVTASNLADMNSQIQLLAHTDMANVQPMVNAINKILAYTTDATNPAPTDNDYLLAGISNVTADNLALLNADVGDEALTLPEIQLTADQLSHLVLIRNYSQDSTNTEPTLDNYTGANIGVPRAENITDYNTVIGDALFTTRVELENVVNAINTLDDYADGTITTAPSIASYHSAGFGELKAMHLPIINAEVSNNTLSTLAEIQVPVNALASLEKYAIDNANTAPSLNDYSNAGITSVSSNIVDYLNSHLYEEKFDSFTHYLKASNSDVGDQFGYETEISADGLTIAVLARFAPSVDVATDDAGAVYVYRRAGDTWNEVAILRSNQTVNHALRMSMSSNGQRIAISGVNSAYVFEVNIVDDVPQWAQPWSMTTVNHGITDELNTVLLSPDGSTLFAAGALNSEMKIFQKQAMGWALLQELDHTLINNGYGLGMSASENGQVVAVGAYGIGGATNPETGRVLVYRSNGTVWTLTDEIFASAPDADDRFGFSVSLNSEGTRLAVGAPRDDGANNEFTTSGAVYIFDWLNDTWTESAIIRRQSAGSSEAFGVDLAISPDGQHLAASGYNLESVYTYELSDSNSSNWQGTERIFTSPSPRVDSLGVHKTIAFNGKEVVVGAAFDDINYQGVVTDTDGDALFDESDESSTGSPFNNSDTSLSDSGAVYVLAYDPYALPSTDRLQARVDAVNVILAWAAGGTTEPTEQHFADASIAGITTSNLSDVNAQLQLLAHTDMFAVQPMVDSINVIQAYATDNTQPSPALIDYVTAGISGVSATNLNDVNGQVDNQSLTPMASVQTMVDSFNVVQTYALDNTQPAPSEVDFTNVGVTGVTASNLTDVNAQVHAQTLTTTATIQTVVSSFTLIEAYAADNTQTAPSETDFTNIGVTGVTASNLSDINEQVDSQSLSSTVSIQTVVDNHNRIATFAADNTQTAPDVVDYTNIGVSGVDAVNLPDVNQQVDAQSLNTIANVQTMVASLNVIENYAADNTQATPSVTDYANVGVSGVTTSNLSDVNAQVDGQSLSTIADVQTLVSSLNVIEAYVQDNTQPAPQEIDYVTVGITGVDTLNLADINQQVDEQSLLTVDGIRSLVTSLTTIRAYANDNTQPEPVLNDYLTVGVAAVDANNLSEMNQQVDEQSLITVNNMRTVLASLNAIRAYAVDNTQSTPVLTDFVNTGIPNVTTENISDINQQIDEQSLDTVNAIRALTTSINVIRAYAADNTQPTPALSDYQTAGITSVSAENLSDINQQVDEQSLNVVDDIRALATSLNIIRAYAADNTQPAPTTNDYVIAGISGVDALNLAEMNQQVDEQSLNVVNDIRTLTTSVNIIRAFAQDNTQAAPSVNDYTIAGVSGVDATNLSEINQEVDLQSLITIDAIRILTQSITTIRAYAVDNTQTAPSVLDYQAAGISGVDAANLNEVNQQVDEQSLNTVNAIQALMDSVNVIRAYASDNTQPTPSVTDYQIVGVSGVDALNLAEINQQVDEQTLITINGIRTLTKSINIIRAYAQDNTQPAPELSDYLTAGITDVSAANLADINQQVDEQSLNVVDDIRTLATSLNIIRAYAVDNNQPAPDENDYSIAGITGIDTQNLAEINQQVDEQSLDVVNDIRTMTESLNIIRAFAIDNTQPAPDENYYAIAGVSGVDSDNLSEINQEVDQQSLITIDAIRALTQSINTIRVYAADNTLTAPSVLDYQTAGISGVDAGNLSEVNQQVDEQSLLTVNGIQTLTDSLNTLRSYAVDNTQPAPSVNDYQIVGVSGVDSDNLDDINQQVDEQTLLSVDAMRSLTSSLNTIRAYAEDNTQPAPSDTDYTIVGVSGVDTDNVSEINQQVDEQSILVVDEMRDVMASVLTIRTYAGDNTQAAPELSDFTKLGISGVDAPNLAAINEQINLQTLDTVNAIRTLVSSFNVIRAYAADNTQPEPSVSDYSDVGIAGVDSDNLAQINQQVDEQSLITISGIRDVVNSVNVIRAYATDNTLTAPDVTDYAIAGVSGVDADNLADINAQVNEQTLLTINEIRTLTNSLNVIRTYAQDNTAPAPSDADYVNSGIADVDLFNLADINQQVDEQSLLAVEDIRTLVASLTTIRAYAADNNAPAPALSDYQIVGVSAVDTNNLAEMNQQVDEQSLITVNNMRTVVASLNVIRAYAADNTQTAPELSDFVNTGITNVTADNIADINQQIDEQSLDTVNAIRGLTTSINIIRSFAADNSQPAPELSDYLTAGISAVSVANLADINQQVDEQSLNVVDDIRTLATSLNIIRAYAADNNQPAPDENDYSIAGISGVDTQSLAEINQQVDEQSLDVVNDILTMTESMNIIRAFAIDNTQPAPDENDYAIAGVSGVDAANLNEVNQQVDEQSLIAVDSIQTMLDSLNVIRVYAQDSLQQVPSVTDYQIAGVQDVTEENLSDINQQVNEQSLLSVNAMRDLTASLNTIRAYAVDSTQTMPSATDYQVVGVSDITNENLSDINQQVNEQSLQIVNDIRTLISGINRIRAYASDNTQVEPTIDDYALAGISGVDELNLAQINQQVDEQSLNVVNDIRAMAASLNRIRTFAQDDSQPAPDENDYMIAGVSSVDANNLSEINQEVAAQSLITVNAMRTLTQSLNIIRVYANDNTQPTPVLNDYLTVGVSAVDANNLSEMNQQVDEQSLITINNMRTVVASLITIRAYAVDNTQSAPVLTDFVNTGIVNVTADNIDDINQQIDEQSLDTVNAIRALISSINIIRAYAADNSQPAPVLSDYQTAGITAVTAENLADINQQVDEQSLDVVDDIRTLAASLNIIRAYAADNTQPVPQTTDYAITGIPGVDTLNLAEINQQVDEQSLNVVNDIRTLTTSVNIIRAFAQDNTQPAPSVTDYPIAGVSGVDALNLAEINKQVDEQTLLTVNDIRTLTTSINTIRNFAADNTLPAPELSDYLIAGISTVNAANLADINQQVDEQSLKVADDIRTLATSLNIIRAYAADNNQPAPDENDYAIAGISGVDALNLAEINQQVDEQLLDVVNDIRTMTESINIIRAFAEDNTQPAPRVNDYTIAGVTGVDTANLNEVNQQVDEQSLIVVDSIQIMIDSLNVIRVYAQDSLQQAPGVTDYQIAGVQDVTEENLSDINQQVNEQSLLSVNAMRDLTASLNTIRAFAVDSSLTPPSVDDYQLAGITAVNDDNLVNINQQVDEQSLNVVDDIRTMAASLNIIRAFAADNTQVEPTIDDYALAGIGGVDELNLAQINQQVDEQSLNVVNDIRAMAASINRIRAFAQDDSQPVPDENDYAIAGVSGVDADNLSEINQEVAAQSLITVNAMRTLTQSLNVIRDFAAGNSQQEPTTEDYRTIGIVDVTEENLEEINQQVDEQTLQTVNSIQIALNSLNTVRAYANDNTQSMPSVSDYQTVGVSGVDAFNLAEINQQVDKQSLLTVNGIQTLTDSLNVILTYVQDHTQAAPSVLDYRSAGLAGVDENNLVEVNLQVSEQLLDTVQGIQTTLDSMNTLRRYAQDNNQPEPSLSDYKMVGITTVSEENLVDINQQVNAQSLMTVNELQILVTSFNTILAYSLDNTNPEPTVLDYRNIGIVSVDTGNIDYINEVIGESGLITHTALANSVSEVVFELSRAGIEVARDMDGDGIVNEWDEDIDGDGITNEHDMYPLDPLKAFDIDGDGIADATNNFDINVIELPEAGFTEVVGGQVYQFSPLSLANGGLITDASAFLGNISIVDNALIYKTPEDFPQQLYIEYEVTLPRGDIRKYVILLVNAESLPEGKPRFINIEPVNILATGLFTPIIDLSPKATDILGNPLPVSIASNQPRLRPGNHVVYWQSDDTNTGQSQLVGQLFRIQPLVTLGQGKYIYEGHQASVKVHLNGPSPDYPVTVPVLVDETLSTTNSSDYSLPQTQNVVITSGLEGDLVFDVIADELVENEERLVLKLGSEVNVGPKNELTLLIQESEPAPLITAHIENGNSESRSIVPVSNSEALYLIASIDNLDTPTQVLWSYAYDSEEKTPIGEVDHTQQLLFDLPLKVGRYRFFVEASDLGEERSIDASVDLRVTDTIVLTMDKDSDNDGIPDLAEGFLDSDGDLIPDYIDAVNGCEIQVIDNERAQTGGFVLQSSSGSCLKLGYMSEAYNTYSPYVEGSKALSIASIPIDVSYEEEFNNSELSNFLVTNVQDESISIVLPLMRPLSSGGTFRKYTEARGWFDFDTSEEGSNLRYAQGELGFCPPPNSKLYQEEALLGANCLEVTIRDGGVHDGDGVRNGSIDDPGYIVYEQRPLKLEEIIVNSHYSSSNSQTNHEVSFNLCNYIQLDDCDISILSIDTELLLDHSIEGTVIRLQVDNLDKNYLGRVTFEKGGIIGSVDMQIRVSASSLELTYQEKTSTSGGGVSNALMCLLSLLSLWRFAQVGDRRGRKIQNTDRG